MVITSAWRVVYLNLDRKKLITQLVAVIDDDVDDAEEDTGKKIIWLDDDDRRPGA